jgi:hypothetical protein
MVDFILDLALDSVVTERIPVSSSISIISASARSISRALAADDDDDVFAETTGGWYFTVQLFL